jgi:flavin-dependent dehydrogenase
MTTYGGNMFDVIVAGAGPAGSVAAKRCAEYGLKTLIVEKKKLPRDKVCSGMVMAPFAQALVQKEFGQIPQKIVLQILSGLILRVPEIGQCKIDIDVPITWRRDLDNWMTETAKEKGVEVWDNASIRKLVTDGKICRVIVQNAGTIHELEARFMIGADGINSVTRKFLFPELSAKCTTAYRECYQGRLDLEEGYTYIVFPAQDYRPNFWILPKGDCFTLEGGLRVLRNEMRDILTSYGFNNQKPLWKDGCLSRVQISGHPYPDVYTSARGNVLLAGDAARLKIPVSGEGIGTALKSGILAASSIVKSLRTGKEVSEIYTNELNPLLETLHSYYLGLGQIKKEAQKGPEALLNALTSAYDETIRMVDF